MQKIVIGDEYDNRHQCQTCMECCHACATKSFVGCLKHNSLQLGPIKPSSPYTKELYGCRFWFCTCCVRSPHPMEKAKRIDVVSRVFFPLVFAVFNIAYWTTYLIQANAEFEETLKTWDLKYRICSFKNKRALQLVGNLALYHAATFTGMRYWHTLQFLFINSLGPFLLQFLRAYSSTFAYEHILSICVYLLRSTRCNVGNGAIKIQKWETMLEM